MTNKEALEQLIFLYDYCSEVALCERTYTEICGKDCEALKIAIKVLSKKTEEKHEEKEEKKTGEKCFPGDCDNCVHIGGGYFLCLRPYKPNLVLEDWEPTEHYLQCKGDKREPQV